MLTWSSEPAPSDPNVPHVAAPASEGCLSLEHGRSGDRVDFARADGRLGGCSMSRLPLVRQTIFGSNKLFSDLEIGNLDLGQLSAHEVKVKVGISRDLFDGIHAALDGSIGRVLSSVAPVFDERLHLGLNRALDAHWETGLESNVSALGGLARAQLTERSTLVFVRARYSLFGDRGNEHRGELKLSADSAQGGGQNAGRHLRADLRYEYRPDVNILSVGLKFSESEPRPTGGDPALRLDLRATRPF